MAMPLNVDLLDVGVANLDHATEIPLLSGDPTMPRPLTCLTAFALTALAASSLGAQEAAELCQAIGNVTLGQWASYTMSGGQADGAKIRLAIVGQERRGGSAPFLVATKRRRGPPGQ